eukprot:TRINITY_DN6576_c0_g1_i1.p4 TRINITY_DN6576_c0_g1~~TRINITY_DN6576_c0_g1_i1.p4  ORF type:complete len:311 (+),score=132.97 TRINITY_DN6576_c0_g1_i1:2406-3338(+)
MPFTNEQLKEAFNLFDCDMGGYIDQEEMELVFKGLGMVLDRVEVEDMMRPFDTDGDGKISFDEFCVLVRQRMKENEGPKEVLEAFKAFDLSNTGVISKDNLREVAEMLSERVTDQDIDEIWHYCAMNDADDAGVPNFTFHAWRAVIDQISNRGANKESKEEDGEEELNSTKKAHLPAYDSSIWTDLEIQEEVDRTHRLQECNKKEEDAKLRQEKAKDAKAMLKKYKAETQAESTHTVKESKWRQRQEENDIVKERLAKKRAALQAQAEEREQQRKREEQEEAEVQKKLEQKRENLKRTDGMVDPEPEEQA